MNRNDVYGYLFKVQMKIQSPLQPVVEFGSINPKKIPFKKDSIQKALFGHSF
jgi:hypothetical protein